MRIIKIHYTPSVPVTSWGEIQDAARELLQLVDADNFPGNNPEAIAIHHAQVSEAPFAFFAVNSKYLEPFDLTRRLIINPRIVAVDESSVVYVKEACMSFPYRSGKHLLRYGHIMVEYQIPVVGELEKLVEECEGLIAACKCLRPIAPYPYGSISDRVTRACGGGGRRWWLVHSGNGPHFSGRPDVH